MSVGRRLTESSLAICAPDDTLTTPLGSLLVADARDGTAEDARENEREYLNPDQYGAGDDNPLPLGFDEVLELVDASGVEYSGLLLQSSDVDDRAHRSNAGLAVGTRLEAARDRNFDFGGRGGRTDASLHCCAVVAVEAGVDPVFGVVGAAALEVALDAVDQHFSCVRVSDAVVGLDQFQCVPFDFVPDRRLVVDGPEERGPAGDAHGHAKEEVGAQQARRLSDGAAAAQEADHGHDASQRQQHNKRGHIVLAHLVEVQVFLRVPPEVGRATQDPDSQQPEQEVVEDYHVFDAREHCGGGQCGSVAVTDGQ